MFIRKRGAAGFAAIAASALALSLAGAPTASADPAASSNDVVGVGSDTLQYMLDFGADGDFNSNPGYNAGKLSRLVSFDATPDANARAGYLNGSTSTTLKALNPTVVLRAGSTPIQRPNGSGAGIGALAIDQAHNIDFARSSSALNAGQVATATGSGGVGDLHEVRLAHDFIHMAVGQTTNSPGALSKAQLKAIYECTDTKWTQVGGSSTDTIIPILPQNGSGTRKTFLTDIGFTTDANGNVTEAPGGCVKTYEENDPYALYVDGTGSQVSDPYALTANPNADALEPMSDGRLNLYAAGYFTNPNLAYGTTTSATDEVTLSPNVKELTAAGNASDGAANYVNKRGLYVIFRESDITSSTRFNGSTLNWVKTLFLNSSAPKPFFATGSGQALLSSAGVVPDYGDCGKNPTSASACPPFSS